MERQDAFQRVKDYIERHRMIDRGDTVVAGVSGGADSVCLFLMLCELREELGFRLVVVHVNHGIREEAGDDAAYVKGLCEGKGVPFVLVEEDVRAYAEREHLSEEEAGRKVRYRAFEEAWMKYGGDTAEEGYEKGESEDERGKEGEIREIGEKEKSGRGRIAVAHNANDRAETMLFHLFRGCGLTGAGGIRPVRGRVIRPILCLERREIEGYLKEKGVSFCIDRTNLEDTYTRNRIRNHILPYAEREVCMGTVSHMCEAADLFLEADGYIRRQAERAYADCILEAGREKRVLDADRLAGEESLIRRQVLLYCLEELTEGRKDITSVHIRDLEGLLWKTGSKGLSLPYGLRAKKEYNRFILYKEGAVCREGRGRNAEGNAPPEEIPVLWTGKKQELEIPGLGTVEIEVLPVEKAGIFFEKSEIIPEKTYTKWLDYDRITKSLMFRTRKAGDYLTINKGLSRKKLKDYMIEEKIPRNARGNFYVLADGSHIVWVPGYRISEYYKITGQTKHILKVQLRGGF